MALEATTALAAARRGGESGHAASALQPSHSTPGGATRSHGQSTLGIAAVPSHVAGTTGRPPAVGSAPTAPQPAHPTPTTTTQTHTPPPNPTPNQALPLPCP